MPTKPLYFRALLALGAVLSFANPAAGEVMRFEILSREAGALGGRDFGRYGQVEKITARATIALDPVDPRNAVIVDLDRAPRNAEGLVEATTDVMILRPDRPNGTMVFEVLNRGRKLITGWTQDTDAVAGIRQERAEDAGNGFLLNQGFTMVWAGWQHDLADNPGLMRINLPIAVGITGPSREEWSFTDAVNPKRASLSYPVADRASARLTVRSRTDQERQPLAEGSFRFVDDHTIEIDRPSSQPEDALYELTYTARDSKVTGIGLAAIRDVASFLRREGGEANPLAAGGRPLPSHAVGFGISQSGRVLRDFLYFGMNQDEAGRIVFEGMMPLIPGARRSFTNARFGQPGRNPGPQYDRLYPVLQFPFTYEVLDDPLSGRRDGLLLRCRLTNTCPLVMQMDSEFEFWGSQASLLVTDPRGHHIELPANVRAYAVAGAPHGNPWNAVARRTAACAMPLNPISQGPVARALLVAMERWVREGAEPPSSRYPMLAHGTLVPAADAYPVIPGLPYRQQYAQADFIEQAAPLPIVRGSYPLFMPRAGLDGNAIAGIRLPIIAVPRATYVGWNPQAEGEGPQELCTQSGGVVPLPETRAARQASADPRPSIEELYPTPGAYVAAVEAAAHRMVAERVLLPMDAEAAVSAARAGVLSQLSP